MRYLRIGTRPGTFSTTNSRAVGVSRRRSPGSWLTVLLPVISFLVYAGTIFTLPQQRDHSFIAERTSLGAAVSHSLYGAPFGTIYTGVSTHLPDNADVPLRQLFEEISKQTTKGALLPVTNDGNGIGYVLAATAAIALFGLHAWSLTLFSVALMGLSALMFWLRFSKEYAGIVTLYFSILTVMLFTILVWDPITFRALPIGGIRYYTLVAILPAFHLVLEILDTKSHAVKWPTLLLVAGQMGILLIAALVRVSAEALIGVIVLTWVVLAWKTRHDRDRTSQLRRKGAIMALVGIGSLGAIVLSAPEYEHTGRLTTVFWHRFLIGLNDSPKWPFGNIAETYDCSQYPPYGMRTATGDEIGVCIWTDYALKHGIPPDQWVPLQFGGAYDAVMRKAFFDIVLRYPGEALKTFFYYKPLFVVRSIYLTMTMKINAYPGLSIGLLIAALATQLMYLITRPGMSLRNNGRLARITVLFAISSIPAYLVAWAVPYTTADLFFYCLLGVGLAFDALFATAFRLSGAEGSSRGASVDRI